MRGIIGGDLTSFELYVREFVYFFVFDCFCHLAPFADISKC